MDNKIKMALQKEQQRQQDNIELIASENYTSPAVRELQGSILTNKYAEGYPDKRYYGGCENVDTIEKLAIEYACQLFHCQHANVQPHSGSQANMEAYAALLNPGDKILSMDLSAGGHLSHSSPLSFISKIYDVYTYGVKENGLIDYEAVEQIAIDVQPKLIIAGASAYPRNIDFSKFKGIADKVGAYLVVDMAHIAGLVAAGLHQNPCDYADIVTSTVHKTLRGPRGGLILWNNDEYTKAINRSVFPTHQGGPLEHIIAAKAQCFYEALQPEFKDYQLQVLKNIKALAKQLQSKGIQVITGGTDNHLILVDVHNSLGITGKEAETILDKAHITVNKNTIPGETLSPMKASGIRIGSPAMTTRGFNEEDFKETGDIIYNILTNKDNNDIIEQESKKVLRLTRKYPII